MTLGDVSDSERIFVYRIVMKARCDLARDECMPWKVLETLISTFVQTKEDSFSFRERREPSAVMECGQNDPVIEACVQRPMKNLFLDDWKFL